MSKQFALETTVMIVGSGQSLMAWVIITKQQDYNFKHYHQNVEYWEYKDLKTSAWEEKRKTNLQNVHFHILKPQGIYVPQRVGSG